MINRLLDLLAGRAAPALENNADELELAVAALMIEAARMDKTFDQTERAAIERLLAERFGLDSEAIRQLIEAAERLVSNSAQYYPFTQKISKAMSIEERAQIIEMLWTVAYADGVLDQYEDTLLRQIAGLIHVPDRDRAIARRRALARLAVAESAPGEAD